MEKRARSAASAAGAGAGAGAGGGGNENVKVVVRCRPLSQRERDDGQEQVVSVCGERGEVRVRNPRAPAPDKIFTFDAVYDETASHHLIYDEMVRGVVEGVPDGYNGCVFAYGQTGTGKTHTMAGVTARACAGLWAALAARPARTHLVLASYLELYRDEVRDLLDPAATSAPASAPHQRRGLALRGTDAAGFHVPELRALPCPTAAHLERLVRDGERRRQRATTDANAHSSRSHALLLISVESVLEPAGGAGQCGQAGQGGEAGRAGGTVRVGKLWLVDLAGSERARKSGAEGERLREAATINHALSALGNVISALALPPPPQGHAASHVHVHVPYRDSKLTMILRDSLGGNSRTLMIATIAPTRHHLDETLTTLRYAHRAKAIRNKPVRNEEPRDAKLQQYQDEIARLRALIAERRAAPAPAPAPAPHPQLELELELEAQVAGGPGQGEEVESSLREEQGRTSSLEAAVAALEQRLAVVAGEGGAGAGGGGGVGAVVEGAVVEAGVERAARELAAREAELGAARARHVRMVQRLEAEEESTAEVTRTFSSLRAELEHLEARAGRCVQRYLAARAEAADTRDLHDQQRRDLEGELARHVLALRRRLLLADSFVPHHGRHLVHQMRYDPDTEQWEMGEAGEEGAAAAAALLGAGVGAGAPHRDVLQLRPLPLARTTRSYRAPPPAPPALRAALAPHRPTTAT